MRIAALTFVLLMGANAPAERAPIATTASGPLRGVWANGISAFKGIPYAKAPTGALRWHAPLPADAWRGTRDASAYGNDCLQARYAGDLGTTSLPMSEDCLYLNVWTPNPVRGTKQAVLVYIHGGGFTGGTGSAAILDGSKLAARGAVVVTLNYRLGRFGFFATPALSKASGGGPTGNWGLMDQIAALLWVKKNIAAFGGDPANVTIFGESAGGESVNRLMASPMAKGLFAKAIASSGGGRDRWPTLAEAERKGSAFAASVGIVNDDLADLRAISPDKVLGGINLLNPDEARYSGPITDGKIVTGDTDMVFASGKAARVPYIVGSNSDELGFIPAPFLKGMIMKATATLGSGSGAVLSAYRSQSAYDRHVSSDFTFTEPARALAARQARTGAGTWVYRFDYVAEAKRKPGAGASHASDVPFQFGNLAETGATPSPADLAAAKLIGDYWVTFAKTGNPNRQGLPAWPRYMLATPNMLTIGNDETKAAVDRNPIIAAISAARDAEKKASGRR